jgi:hypothetical protein
MRIWLSGPRMFRGMIRLGISLGPEDFRSRSMPSPRRQLQGSFIYVISDNHGLIKVGISINPAARLTQLQTASATPLKIAYVGALRCSGYAIEAETRRLAAYRRSGEWFDVPPDLAVAAVCAAAYRLGEPIASGDPMLADETVRGARLGIAGSAALAIIKFVIAIPLALVIWLDFWILYQLI